MEINQPPPATLITVKDGSTTVLNVKELDFSGATVTNGGGGIADITIVPGQTVTIASGTGISVTGSYPNFTITNTLPDQTVSIAAGTFITSVTGTYPNFTINAANQATDLSGQMHVDQSTPQTLGATGARATKLWTTNIESTNAPTVSGVAVPTISSTNTLTNKRNTPRIYSTTDISGTPGVLTPEIDTYDYFELTAQAHALNIANKSTSTPTGGEKMIIAITSDGSAHALTYGTDYVANGGVALPTTTVISKTTTMGFIWNAGLGKWNLVAVAQQ